MRVLTCFFLYCNPFARMRCVDTHTEARVFVYVDRCCVCACVCVCVFVCAKGV